MAALFTCHGQLTRGAYWQRIGVLTVLTCGLLVTLMSTVLQYPAFRLKPAYLNPGKTLLLLVTAAGLFTCSLITLAATLQRLHDRHRTGRFLGWLALPVIGWGLVLVQLLGPSRGPRTPVATSFTWRQRVRTWCLLISGTLLYAVSLNFVGIAALRGAHPDPLPTNSAAPAAPTAANRLILGRHNISLANHRTYRVAYRNRQWAHTTFAIDRITVYRTYGPYRIPSNDGPLTINGIIGVHMKIHAGANIQTYPVAKTLTTNDGQRLIADRSNSDVFAGDLNQGTRTAGTAYYLMPRLNEVADVTRIDVSWDAVLRSQPQFPQTFHANIPLTVKK